MGDANERTGDDLSHRLCIQSQVHGEICFDLGFTGHREDILSSRVPRSGAVHSGEFVESLAAASISKLAGREFDPSNEEDRKVMRSLQIGLTDQERRSFATKFLEVNDYLLCRTESSKSADGHTTVSFVLRDNVTWEADPAARLHQAYRIWAEEADAMARSAFGPAITPSMFESWSNSQAREFASAVAGFQSAMKSRCGPNMYPALSLTAGQAGKAYEHPSIKMLADIDATARMGMGYEHPSIRMLADLAAAQTGKSQRFPTLAALQTSAGLLSEQYGPGIKELARRIGTFSEGPTPALLQAAEKANSLLGRFNTPSWWSQDLATWRQFGFNPTPQITLAQSAFGIRTAGILDALADKKLLNDLHLIPQLLRPAHAYTSFVSETVRLASEGGPALRAAYDSALLRGAAHLDSTYASLDRLVRQQVAPDKAVETAPQPEQVGQDFLSLQRDELVEQTQALNIEPRDASAVGTLVADIGVLAAGVLHAVPACNDAALLVSGREIFSPTNRMLHASARLMNAVPTDEPSFGRVIDDLYFLIYEGGGEDKLRFLTENGGAFGREESHVQPVFWLKAFRNHLRHDPNRGNSKDHWSRLRRTLQEMGLSAMPNQPDEFKFLYRGLLRGLAAFLAELGNRLQSK